MFEEGVLLDCPKCGNKITVPLDACKEGRKFPCPICSVEVCFQFTEEQLAKLTEKQRRDLAQSFPLAFGRI